MSITKPYKRTIRKFTNNRIQQGGLGRYIMHKDFSENPEHYVRAFLIIQKDFINLLDYIEPSDKNLSTYSFRIHELLLRVCIEIEANFVAILKENGYQKEGNWTMLDYKKVNVTHHLSSYQVKFPVWYGDENIRHPFEEWNSNSGLGWWNAYNKTKHDRHKEFEKATFKSLTDAMSGLIALLSAQFEDNDFSPADMLFSAGGVNDGMSSAIGDYFRVKYPDDWDENEKYDFDWRQIEQESNPIMTYDYNN